MSEEKRNQLAIVLKYSGALAAEGHLTDVANKEGDGAVAQIARTLSSAEISEVISEADLTKPSLLHTAINPEQFRGVFRRVAIRWSIALQDECPPEALIEFQNELQQFLCAFILLNDDEARRKDLLGAILAEPYGLDALVFSVIQEKDFPDFAGTPSGLQSEVGDWREVIGILRIVKPREWDKFLEIVSSLDDEDKHHTFLHDTAAEMYEVAVFESGQKPVQAGETDELFTALP